MNDWEEGGQYFCGGGKTLSQPKYVIKLPITQTAAAATRAAASCVIKPRERASPKLSASGRQERKLMFVFFKFQMPSLPPVCSGSECPAMAHLLPSLSPYTPGRQ